MSGIKGLVDHQMDASLNIGFAPTRDVDRESIQERRGDVVKFTGLENGDVTDGELLDLVRGSAEQDPDRFDLLVQLGADDQGIGAEAVGRARAFVEHAMEVAADDTKEPRRRKLCGEVGSRVADVILWLAMEGQRVVNERLAAGAMQRASAVVH